MRKPKKTPKRKKFSAKSLSSSKVVTLEALSECARQIRSQKQNLVLCHGVFDLMHNGHIRHLQAARKHGDALAVTITCDEHVRKGPGRPVFTENLRAEALAALECVDFVAINPAPTAINVIKAVKPKVYAKGSDYKHAREDVTGNILLERNAVQACGGHIAYTDEITFSSTGLLNEHFGIFPDDTKHYLDQMKKKYGAETIIESMRGLKSMKVCVVGDAILDEYNYTKPMGLTGKGHMLAVKYVSREKFAGGVQAAANHIAGFVKNTTLLTALGKEKSYESFFRSKLAPNLKPIFHYVDHAPTVVKRRFVDTDMVKLFEVYEFRDEPLPARVEKTICKWLKANLGKYDLVVVPDFGNGLITPKMIEHFAKYSKYLAVNTQMNSGNQGYHAITRYPRANFVSLNEPEIRVATHNRHGALKDVALGVAKRVHASALAVTRGTKGAVMYDSRRKRSFEVPALSTKVVDRIGAGDSFLSLASLCLAAGFEPELAVFIASATAALDVQIVCNREPVAPPLLYKYIRTLLR